jgi:hypothetical protein
LTNVPSLRSSKNAESSSSVVYQKQLSNNDGRSFCTVLHASTSNNAKESSPFRPLTKNINEDYSRKSL